jgi:mono/diheme cytochrome c family protein
MRSTRFAPTFIGALLSLAMVTAAHGQGTVGSSGDPAAAAARQLELGEQWFRSACLECHAVRGLDNADFRLKWGGRNALDLFELIRSTMPEHKPGSLTQGTYAAIVAYLLKLNGMPPSQRLSSDSTQLAAIRLRFAAAPASSHR